MWPVFFKFRHSHIFGIGKAKHFKFCVLIDACIIYYLQKMCLESRDLFKLGEISDDISLTVQDRDIVAKN